MTYLDVYFLGQCGISPPVRHTSNKIVGGTIAAVGEFPWQVVLFIFFNMKHNHLYLFRKG